MNIGQVIRKYRKIKDMTQEEMAGRLGVTAPAVNKWENGVSMPDITLLAPIARLLGISLDTLLAFRGDLTDNEVNELVKTLRERLKTEEFASVFRWAREQMERYPNCERLQLYMTLILNGVCMEKGIADGGYERYLLTVNERLLNSNEESVRTTAAEALHGFYIRKEEYDKAEEYLSYFSLQNPERKRKKAFLCAHSGRTQEAYRLYEELLYSEFNMLYMTLHGMFAMRLKEQDLEKAKYLEDRMIHLIRTFEMGRYHEASTRLDLAIAKKDEEGTLACARQMLDGLGQFGSWRNAPLYEHLAFKELSGGFAGKMRETLLAFFREEDKFGYMKGNAAWDKLLEENEGKPQ